jgi:hypothetical protein
VYFVVLILLLGLFPLGCSLRGVFGGTRWFGTTTLYLSSGSDFGERLRRTHSSRLHSGGGAVLLSVYMLSERDACLLCPFADTFDALPLTLSASLCPGGRMKSVLEPTRL